MLSTALGGNLNLDCTQSTTSYFHLVSTDISNHENQEHSPQHNNVNTFLGQFGIGEIMRLERYNILKKVREDMLCFVFNSLILYEFGNDTINFEAIKRLNSWRIQK
jgi:DNA replication protein DnaD